MQFSTCIGVLNVRTIICISACLCVVFVGCGPQAYSTYANGFKAVFNLTHTKAESIASVLFIGSGTTITAGMLLDHADPIVPMLITVVASTAGWMLLWSATLMPRFMHDHFIILVIYVFVAGYGRTYGFVTSLLVSMQQVAPAHRTLIVVMVETFFDFGTFLCVLLYESSFINGHIEDAENQNLSGFFLTISIIIFIVNTLGTVAIRICNRKWEDSFEYISLDDVIKEPTNSDSLKRNLENCRNNDHNTNLDTTITESSTLVDKKESTGLLKYQCISACTGSVLLRADFHLILWSTAIAMGVCTFTAMNLTYISMALSFSVYDYWIVSLHRLFVLLGRICLGLPMALCQSITTMSELVLVVTLILVVIGQIVQLTCGHELAGIFASMIITAIAHGASYILPPILVHFYFGMDHYGRNISIIYSLMPILTVCIGVFFGGTYDNQIDSKDSHYCYGMACLRAGLSANIAVSSIGLLLSCILIFRKCKK